MKPRRSPTTTGDLPICSANSRAVATTVSSVTTVRTSSMSFITGAGLKKWKPRTRLGREACTAMSITGSEEVLVAMIASSRTAASIFSKAACLRGISSGTASTTRSQSARTPKSVEPLIRPAMASRSSCSSFPRDSWRSREAPMRSRPRVTAASSTSTKATSRPLRATISAMPDPMVPHPTTPTLRICSATTVSPSTRCHGDVASLRGGEEVHESGQERLRRPGCPRRRSPWRPSWPWPQAGTAGP